MLRHSVRNSMISSLVDRRSPRLQTVYGSLCHWWFCIYWQSNLSDSDICEDLLHWSYSGLCKPANNFIGAINKNLEKCSFWQSRASSSQHGSVSTSEKSPEKKQPISAGYILILLLISR